MREFGLYFVQLLTVLIPLITVILELRLKKRRRK